MARKRKPTPEEQAAERAEWAQREAEWERERKIKEENFTESPVLKNTFTCDTCSALVHDNNLSHHFNWHDGENTRFNSLKRDVEHIERNVDLPSQLDY